MARLEFKNFANRKTLNALPKALIKRLLEPHRTYCEGRGLDIDALKDGDSDDNDRLMAFFSTPDPGMTPALLQALHQVDALSTEHGHDLLLDYAEESGVPLGVSQPELGPRGFALLAYLDHRDLFLVAHDRQSIEKVQSFQEYAAKADRRLKLESVQPKLKAVEEELGKFFQQRRRSEYCKIRSYLVDDEFSFVISHGRLYRSDGSVEKERWESQVSYRPLQDDVVQYDNRSFRLKVKASDPKTREQYRRAFASQLFSDADFFGTGEVFTLKPLLDLGSEALVPTPGIKSVALVELRWMLKNNRRTVFILQSNDVLGELEGRTEIGLGKGEVFYAKLMVRYASGGRPRKIELKLPNQAIYNRGRDLQATKDFLEQRGFNCPRVHVEDDLP